MEKPTAAVILMAIAYFIITPSTEYHFRIKAVNSGGIAYGNDETFKTLTSTDPVTDIDGNTYKTVPIGNQIWMAENLKTTHYNDGTSIPLVTDYSSWSNLTTPGFCWYNNETTYKFTNGGLYNWFTVNTGKLCPLGWHVPTDIEWSKLAEYLGGETLAGGKLKEIGTIHWIRTNTEVTNETDFTALPSGNRSSYDGAYYLIGYVSNWWSSSENDATNACYKSLSSDNNYIIRTCYDKKLGLSVRCLLDN